MLGLTYKNSENLVYFHFFILFIFSPINPFIPVFQPHIPLSEVRDRRYTRTRRDTEITIDSDADATTRTPSTPPPHSSYLSPPPPPTRTKFSHGPSIKSRQIKKDCDKPKKTVRGEWQKFKEGGVVEQVKDARVSGKVDFSMLFVWLAQNALKYGWKVATFLAGVFAVMCLLAGFWFGVAAVAYDGGPNCRKDLFYTTLPVPLDWPPTGADLSLNHMPDDDTADTRNWRYQLALVRYPNMHQFWGKEIDQAHYANHRWIFSRCCTGMTSREYKVSFSPFFRVL